MKQSLQKSLLGEAGSAAAKEKTIQQILEERLNLTRANIGRPLKELAIQNTTDVTITRSRFHWIRYSQRITVPECVPGRT